MELHALAHGEAPAQRVRLIGLPRGEQARRDLRRLDRDCCAGPSSPARHRAGSRGSGIPRNHCSECRASLGISAAVIAIRNVRHRLPLGRHGRQRRRERRDTGQKITSGDHVCDPYAIVIWVKSWYQLWAGLKPGHLLRHRARIEVVHDEQPRRPIDDHRMRLGQQLRSARAASNVACALRSSSLACSLSQ